MSNQVVWPDIPVLDLDRALRFYSAVPGCKALRQEFPEIAMGLPAAQTKHRDRQAFAGVDTS